MNIHELLPHRFPFILIDKIINIEKGKRVEAVRQITLNDPLCLKNGKLKEIFIVEALAQLSGIIIGKKGQGLLAGIKDFNFYGKATAGDLLYLKSSFESSFNNLFIFQCSASTKEDKIAEGKIILHIQ